MNFLSSTVNYKYKRGLWILPLVSILFLLSIAFTVGLRGDHLVFIGLVNTLYFLSDSTRRFITGFSVFAVYWIIYDSMKAFPNYAFMPVDIDGLYNLEKSLFGIISEDIVLTPNEFFLIHTHKAVDLLTAAFYLCWIPVPLMFAFYLYLENKNIFLRFSFAFFVINFIGFIIYYSHPAAPPWYVNDYGFQFNPVIKSNAAGLLRADHLLGIPLFESIYAKGSNVFAAVPSLHATYPMACFYYSLKQPRRWMSVALFILTIGIWVSAIYLTHHYILDVLAGIVCAIAGIILLEKYLLRKTSVGILLKRMEEKIS